MDHIDYIGISTLIAAISAATVSIIAALASLRNHGQITEVRREMNGMKDALISNAHAAGVRQGATEQMARDIPRPRV